MITGYNTDVRYGELVLHVQTEDKGRELALVETLVYVGGTILHAERSGISAQRLETLKALGYVQ